MELKKLITNIISKIKKSSSHVTAPAPSNPRAQIDHFLYGYGENFHCKKEQYYRFQRATDPEKIGNVISVDKTSMSMRITGSYHPSMIYSVTLDKCECQDFKDRSLPCKHIYRLALELGVISSDWTLFDCTSKMEGRYQSTKSETLIDNNTSPKGIVPSVKISNNSIKFCDNMNYMIFEGEGIYEKTGRKRKIHIEAFSKEEALSELVASGYQLSSLNISRSPFDSPTDAQINAMITHGDIIPKNACKMDLSFLMTKIIEDQREPDKKLVEFATNHKIKLSYFIGEESLYSCIWRAFDDTDKATFYLLCVKKDITGKWDFDSWDLHKEKARTLLSDDKFKNSFKRYLTSDFCGFIDNKTSRNTNCYKIAATNIQK